MRGDCWQSPLCSSPVLSVITWQNYHRDDSSINVLHFSDAPALIQSVTSFNSSGVS